MTDKLTPQQRHKNMAAIRSKNTKPEMIVRKGLWSRGFRYRLNHKRLPGHPDLVLRKYRTCIFVNGCFWHGHHIECRVQSAECRVISCASRRESRVERRETKVKGQRSKVERREWRDESGETSVEGCAEKGKVWEVVSSECCKIPKTNREFWVAKIRRNKERDREEQRRLAEMGWHCITVWECELTPKRREETLESLAFTLNHIYLQDHSLPKEYARMEEEQQYDRAAEDRMTE